MRNYCCIFLCVILAAALLAGCGSSAGTGATATADGGFETVTIKFAHTAAITHAHHTAAEQFAQNVNERTGGNVTVELYPAGELGDAPTLAEQISMGSIDINIASMSNLVTYIPKLNALTAPFLFEDYDHAHRVIDNYVMDWMNEDLPSMNVHALSMFDYGFRHTTTKGIEVNSAEDLRGVKIRVPPSPGLLAAFDAVGANTQTIAYSELYSSLKQGVVDGQENPVSTILADCYYECQDQLALTGHFFDCQALVVNKTAWDSYSPALQEILLDEAMKAQQVTRDLIQGGEEETIEELAGFGMNVTYPDKASFVAQMSSAYDTIGELSGAEEMQKLLDAVEANR